MSSGWGTALLRGRGTVPSPAVTAGPRSYGVALSVGAGCPWRGVRAEHSPGTRCGAVPCLPASRRVPAHGACAAGGGGAGSGRCRPLSYPQRRGAAALFLPAQRYGDGGRRIHGVPVTGEGGLRSRVLRTGSALALGGLPETDVPGTLTRTPPDKWRGGREEAASRLPGLPCSDRGLSAGLQCLGGFRGSLRLWGVPVPLLRPAPPEHRRPPEAPGQHGLARPRYPRPCPCPAPPRPGLEYALARPGPAQHPHLGGPWGPNWTNLAVANGLWTVGWPLGQARRSFSPGTPPTLPGRGEKRMARVSVSCSVVLGGDTRAQRFP